MSAPGLTAARIAHAAALTQSQRDKLSPDDIVALMKAGNERFRLGKESPHDYLVAWASATASTHGSQATSSTTTSSGAWSSRARSRERSWCWSWGIRPAAP